MSSIDRLALLFDRLRLAETIQHHIHALGRERTGDAETDAAGRAGHDGCVSCAHDAAPIAVMSGAFVALTMTKSGERLNICFWSPYDRLLIKPNYATDMTDRGRIAQIRDGFPSPAHKRGASDAYSSFTP